ncbi:hypothetical protein KJ713_00425 [Patescibacteria group bacterium]|nr:hypothetical protein [Patescibacteria group bacterium]
MEKKKKLFKVKRNGHKISPKKARIIDRAVKKATKDYHWVFSKLGNT